MLKSKKKLKKLKLTKKKPKRDKLNLKLTSRKHKMKRKLLKTKKINLMLTQRGWIKLELNLKTVLKRWKRFYWKLMNITIKCLNSIQSQEKNLSRLMLIISRPRKLTKRLFANKRKLLRKLLNSRNNWKRHKKRKRKQKRSCKKEKITTIK